MNSFEEVLQHKEINHCPKPLILALKDTMNAVSGKWKLPIIAALFHGKNRFTDLQQSIEKITPRMLSKELKELQINGIISRRVAKASPLLVEYTLTPSGNNIMGVIDKMIDWGLMHRKAEMRMQ